MREVGILDAKTGLSGLVSEVERTGEEIVLTRHGRAVARLAPIVSAKPAQSPEQRKKAMEALLARRDARPFVPGFDDLPWEDLKRIARDEDRYD